MNDTLIAFGEAIKALPSDHPCTGVLGGVLVRFGSPLERDLVGEYFTCDTYFGAQLTRSGTALLDGTLNHRRPMLRGNEPDHVQELMKRCAEGLLPPVEVTPEDHGLFARIVLDLRDEYQRMIYELGTKGAFGWSSGSAAHVVDIASDGHITCWPLIEAGLTPMPCEPRSSNVVMPLKAYLDTPTSAPNEADREPIPIQHIAIDSCDGPKPDQCGTLARIPGALNMTEETGVEQSIESTGSADTITREQLESFADRVVERAAAKAATRAVDTIRRESVPEPLRGEVSRHAGEATGRAPGYIHHSGASNEGRERAIHAAKWFLAAATRNERGLELAFGENPQWYHAKAAFSEASNDAGLYTVPTSWSDMIFSNVENYGFARRLGNVYPMPARDVKFTTGGAVTVSWPGMNTAPTPFDATNFFSQTALSAQTMAAAYVIQKELLDDTIVDLMGYLARQYGRAIAREEDLQFFNGGGTPFTGIIGTSGVRTTSMAAGLTGFDKVSWTHMNNLKLTVNTDIQLEGEYVVPQSVLGYLYNEVDSQNRPIRNVGGPGPAALPNHGIHVAPYTYNNSPLYTLPDALFPASGAGRVCALFGDFRTYGILGVRRDMTVDTYDQSYGGIDLAGKRQLAIQVVERIGIAFPDPSAFGVLKTAAS
jgi:HK97 family phage major capsid protein